MLQSRAERRRREVRRGDAPKVFPPDDLPSHSDDDDEDDFEGNVSPQQLDSGGVIELSTKLLSKCGTPSTRQPTDSQCDK